MSVRVNNLGKVIWFDVLESGDSEFFLAHGSGQKIGLKVPLNINSALFKNYITINELNDEQISLQILNIATQFDFWW